MMPAIVQRRLSAGVEIQPDGSASVRVWAPDRTRVEFSIDGGASHALAREEDGYFAGVIPDVSRGTRYWYRLDGAVLRPDPASRFQPEGPHGPSELPLFAARTISVAVERPGDGLPAEQDPESLATAYLLGDTHWSR